MVGHLHVQTEENHVSKEKKRECQTNSPSLYNLGHTSFMECTTNDILFIVCGSPMIRLSHFPYKSTIASISFTNRRASLKRTSL